MGAVEGVKEGMTNLIGQENVEKLKETVGSLKETVTKVVSGDTVEGVKHIVSEELSIAGGLKDQFWGGVKETVGHYLGNEGMEKEGHEQKLRGEAELAQHRAMGEESDTGVEPEVDAAVHMCYQACAAEICNMGGFEQQKKRLRHVVPRETQLMDLIGKGEFHLKRCDIKPLLADIRSEQNRAMLKHVETKEKGLLFSLPITKEEFHLKDTPRLRLFDDINKEVALSTLHEVPPTEIHDKSAPRLDLPLTTGSSTEGGIGPLLQDIKEGVELTHVETKDKAKPCIDTTTMETQQGFGEGIRAGTGTGHI